MNFLLQNALSRSKYFPVGGKQIKLPIYFPSISTVKTGKMDALNYFKVLRALSPHFLVSAYDIYGSKYRKKFLRELSTTKLSSTRPIIILDSGNYESFWFNDKNWKLEMFNEMVEKEICDLAFCYDKKIDDLKKNVTSIINSVSKSQKVTSQASIVPIVHGNKDTIVRLVSALYKKLEFTCVAVPERELGDGVLERTKTLTELRKKLNAITRQYTYIHVLGTGNPISLMLFAFAGADTFDGLEWCQTVVDSKTAQLHHFHQRDLFNDNCPFCASTDKKFDYNIRTFGHNLNFYNEWIARIQNAIENRQEQQMLSQYLNAEVLKKLQTIWA